MMDEKKFLERKIFLKCQAIELLEGDIQDLEHEVAELKGKDDDLFPEISGESFTGLNGN